MTVDTDAQPKLILAKTRATASIFNSAQWAWAAHCLGSAFAAPLESGQTSAKNSLALTGSGAMVLSPGCQSAGQTSLGLVCTC